MGVASKLGKYHLGRVIGEGAFAKVKLATDTDTGQQVAIKIMDKQMILQNNFMHQVLREITTMKLLHHPNIVQIYEVIATRDKVYTVMEYVSGGQLSDRLTNTKRVKECQVRKLFQQIIDAVDYCHSCGVYHRDLKPQNLLLDQKGNVKLSDFGFSVTMTKPGGMLSTACGSPCYAAPELLLNVNYDGAAVDVWSCGVILYELLSNTLPFEDQNLLNLYMKICRVDYIFPDWFTKSQKKLISRIFDPNPKTRITTAEIIKDNWFRTDYESSCCLQCHKEIYSDDKAATFDTTEDQDDAEKKCIKSSKFINAFQLISMSHGLDLSGIFHEQNHFQQKLTLGTEHTRTETIKKVMAAAAGVNLAVKRTKNYKMMINLEEMTMECPASHHLSVSVEVVEIAPNCCMIEITKPLKDIGVYNQFCSGLSSLVAENSRLLSDLQ